MRRGICILFALRAQRNSARSRLTAGFLSHGVAGREDCVYVNAHCVGDAPRIAARECYRNRHAVASRMVENHILATPQTLHRQCKPTKLILAIRIRSRDVKNQIRPKHIERSDQMRIQNRKVIRIADAIAKMRIQIRGRLGMRIIIFLMN